MKSVNKQTAAIWAEHLGNAYVGYNGMLDELKNDKVSETEIGNIAEASNLIDETINLLNGVAEETVEEKRSSEIWNSI